MRHCSRKSSVRVSGHCPRPAFFGNGLEGVVADYLNSENHKDSVSEVEWFAGQPSLRSAVSLAALAQGSDGKYPHQWRIPPRILRKSRRKLLTCLRTLKSVRTFEELHELIRSRIAPIRGIGPLTVYDTAFRIGAKLALEPNVVFLHAGTRVGAKRLVRDAKRPFLNVDELPLALQRLPAHEIENILCIYRDHF